MAVSRFPKRPVQVKAKAERSRVGKWLIGCGCIAPLGLFALVVALGAALQIFDPEGVERRRVEKNAKAKAQEESQQLAQNDLMKKWFDARGAARESQQSRLRTMGEGTAS